MIKVQPHVINDCEYYHDVYLFADNYEGRDYRAHFYFDKEIEMWVECLEFCDSPPGEAYEEVATIPHHLYLVFKEARAAYIEASEYKNKPRGPQIH